MFKALMEPEVRELWDADDEARLLEAHRRIWRRKPMLRAIYRRWWSMILGELKQPGRTLEVGAGIGEFRRFYRGPCVSTEYLPGTPCDVRCDAHQLPFGQAAFANVVCIDMVHHLERPLDFLAEVERVLEPGGVFVCVEPYLSPFSCAVRRIFHHEEDELRLSEEQDGALTGDMRIPTRIFVQDPAALRARCPSLRVRRTQAHTFLSYPASGGFTFRTLLPEPLSPLVDWLDERLAPLAKLVAMKLLVVVEKDR